MCLDYFIEWWGEQNEAISTKEVFWKVKIVTLLRVILQLSLFRFHLVAFASPFPMSYDALQQVAVMMVNATLATGHRRRPLTQATPITFSFPEI